jgi:hypothetical protein
LEKYPQETLKIDGNELFCEACAKPLINKGSTLKYHFAAASHAKAKVSFLARKSRQSQLFQYYSSLAMAENRNAPANQQAWRYQVVSAFLEAGIPLEKVNISSLHELLESGHPKLGVSTTLADFIPSVRDIELETIRDELGIPRASTGSSSSSTSSASECKVPAVGVYFDGTSRICEVLAIVIRFVMRNRIQQVPSPLHEILFIYLLFIYLFIYLFISIIRGNHTACCSGFNIHNFRTLNRINSQVAEQGNNMLQRVQYVSSCLLFVGSSRFVFSNSSAL